MEKTTIEITLLNTDYLKVNSSLQEANSNIDYEPDDEHSVLLHDKSEIITLSYFDANESQLNPFANYLKSLKLPFTFSVEADRYNSYAGHKDHHRITKSGEYISTTILSNQEGMVKAMDVIEAYTHGAMSEFIEKIYRESIPMSWDEQVRILK